MNKSDDLSFIPTSKEMGDYYNGIAKKETIKKIEKYSRLLELYDENKLNSENEELITKHLNNLIEDDSDSIIPNANKYCPEIERESYENIMRKLK